MIATPHAFTLDALHEGQSVTLPFTISDADMATFAQISGDYNPLHMQDTAAQTRGFEGRVVYGALLIAKLSNLIGMELPGLHSVWQTVDMQFRKPLYIGQEAAIEATISHLSEATRTVTLKFTIRRDGALLAKGSAGVGVMDGGTS